MATALKALVSALLAGGADGVEAPLATWGASSGAARAKVFVHPWGVMVDLGWVTVAVLLISALCICVQVARNFGAWARPHMVASPSEGFGAGLAPSAGLGGTIEPKISATKATQSQATYRWWKSKPEFRALRDREHGCWEY